jgi:hypothetical protein
MYNGRGFRGPSPPPTPKRPQEAKRDQRNRRRKQNRLSVALFYCIVGNERSRRSARGDGT